MEHFSGSHSELSVLTHFLAASIAGCLGYIVGGIMAIAKVSDLYLRLESAEKGLTAHAAIVSELTSAIRLLLSELESVNIHSPSIERARLVLAQI